MTLYMVNTKTKRKYASASAKIEPWPRQGKTARDRANGCQQRNMANKAARASWQAACRQSGGNANPPFPYHTCKGKGNSSKAFKDKPARLAS